MAQGDVSFTFMDRVKEVELKMDDGSLRLPWH